MAVYIELTTELNNTTNLSGKEAIGKTSVRRPLRGLEIREDTYAYIKLVRRDGTPVQLIDSSSSNGTSTEYSNFIFSSVQDQRMEKQQLIETFGADYMMLFGSAPHFLQVTAFLVSSADFNWKAEFLENYERYMRGTKCIEQGARTYLFYSTAQVEGYILNCSVQETGDNPHLVSMTFQFFVTNHRNIFVEQDTGVYPIRSSAILPEGITNDDLRTPMSGELIDALVLKGGPPESGFADQEILRSAPLRGRIADNSDEYTAPPVRSGEQSADDALAEQLIRDAEALDRMLGDLQNAYGVDPNQAYAPDTMNQLGYGPSFGRSGVGIGAGAGASASATFGASASASLGARASVGGNASAGASAGVRLGFSASAGAFAGAGASAGAFANASAGFGAGLGAGAQAGAFAGVSAGAGAPFGSAPYAQAGTYSDSYARTSVGSAAIAGGYAGANLSLGPIGVNGAAPGPGASYAGAYGQGGSIGVSGRASAFGFGVFDGNLRNEQLPPRTAVNTFSESWGWSP